MRRKLLTIAVSAFIFFYIFYAAGGYVFELVYGPFEAYQPFEMSVYVGPIVSLGFCLCAVLGAIFSLEDLETVDASLLLGGTVVMAIAAVAIDWLLEVLAPNVDVYFPNGGWLTDIGLMLLPWILALGVCTVGFRLVCSIGSAQESKNSDGIL